MFTTLQKDKQAYFLFYLFFSSINTTGKNALLKIPTLSVRKDCIFLPCISMYQIAAPLHNLLERIKIVAKSAFLVSAVSKAKKVLGPKLKSRRMGIFEPCYLAL